MNLLSRHEAQSHHQRNLWKQWPQDFQSWNTSKFIEAKVFTTWTCQRAVFAAGAVLDALDFTTCHAKQRGYGEVPCCAKMQCTFQKKKCRIKMKEDEWKKKPLFSLRVTWTALERLCQYDYSVNTVRIQYELRYEHWWTCQLYIVVHHCTNQIKIRL